ncbi:unnamed protein product [Allacma fusca]|uniref:Ionotropic receptor n=1 Tax=Allacma fusca TaxID=39272 RepID=A0A8J2PPC6_9HEXA|nr:unnamed protein product [Allacma fusca]
MASPGKYIFLFFVFLVLTGMLSSAYLGPLGHCNVVFLTTLLNSDPFKVGILQYSLIYLHGFFSPPVLFSTQSKILRPIFRDFKYHYGCVAYVNITTSNKIILHQQFQQILEANIARSKDLFLIVTNKPSSNFSRFSIDHRFLCLVPPNYLLLEFSSENFETPVSTVIARHNCDKDNSICLSRWHDTSLWDATSNDALMKYLSLAKQDFRRSTLLMATDFANDVHPYISANVNLVRRMRLSQVRSSLSIGVPEVKLVLALMLKYNFTMVVNYYIPEKRWNACFFQTITTNRAISSSESFRSISVLTRHNAWSIVYGMKTPRPYFGSDFVSPLSAQVWACLLWTTGIVAVFFKHTHLALSYLEAFAITLAPLLNQYPSVIVGEGKEKYSMWALCGFLIMNVYLCQLQSTTVSPSTYVSSYSLVDLMHDDFRLTVPFSLKYFIRQNYDYLLNSVFRVGQRLPKEVRDLGMLLEFVKVANNSMKAGQYRELYGTNLCGSLYDSYHVKLYAKLLPRLFQQNYFIGKEKFLEVNNGWEFSLPNKDTLVESFKQLQNAGIERLWSQYQEAIEANRLLKNFKGTYSRQPEGKNLNFRSFEELEKSVRHIFNACSLHDSVIVTTAYFYLIGILTSVGILITETIRGRFSSPYVTNK